MALFGKADIEKTKYILAIIGDIAKGNEIKVKRGKTMVNVKFDYNDVIKQIEKVQNDPTKYKKILYPKNKWEPVFLCKEGAYTFVQIDKAPYSKMGGSRNSLGKALADAGELATVASLTTTIKTAKDTGQDIFINNPDAFGAWAQTFLYTKDAVADIVGSLSTYVILHDATDNGPFTKVITDFCKKIKVAKDSWNPADIFIVKKSKLTAIVKELETIVEKYDVQDGLIEMFNNKIYDLYKSKLVYPISLKQLVSNKPTIEYANEPGKIKVANYKIEISSFNVNLSKEGKEIGLFTFSNVDTNKKISLQVRGFPHGYGIAQTEITSDGTPTGGRLGKISTGIVDKIMDEYGDSRITSINFFGRSPDIFGTFDDRTMKEVYSWYTTVIKNKNVKDVSPITYDGFKKLVSVAKANTDVAENLCMKIQGLKMMYFFVKNEKKLSDIMNKMINGAKKISSDNGFFIKIY